MRSKRPFVVVVGHSDAIRQADKHLHGREEVRLLRRADIEPGRGALLVALTDPADAPVLVHELRLLESSLDLIASAGVAPISSSSRVWIEVDRRGQVRTELLTSAALQLRPVFLRDAALVRISRTGRLAYGDDARSAHANHGILRRLDPLAGDPYLPRTGPSNSRDPDLACFWGHLLRNPTLGFPLITLALLAASTGAAIHAIAGLAWGEIAFAVAAYGLIATVVLSLGWMLIAAALLRFGTNISAKRRYRWWIWKSTGLTVLAFFSLFALNIAAQLAVQVSDSGLDAILGWAFFVGIGIAWYAIASILRDTGVKRSTSWALPLVVTATVATFFSLGAVGTTAYLANLGIPQGLIVVSNYALAWAGFIGGMAALGVFLFGLWTASTIAKSTGGGLSSAGVVSAAIAALLVGFVVALARADVLPIAAGEPLRQYGILDPYWACIEVVDPEVGAEGGEVPSASGWYVLSRAEGRIILWHPEDGWRSTAITSVVTKPDDSGSADPCA